MAHYGSGFAATAPTPTAASVGVGYSYGYGYGAHQPAPPAPMPTYIPGGRPHNYKTRMCTKFATSGTCPSGPACNFAHGDAEMRQPSMPGVGGAAWPPQPQATPYISMPPGVNNPRAKTRLCTKWQEGNCTWGENCGYAHGEHELRFTAGRDPQAHPEKHKTRPCKRFSTSGTCHLGDLCTFQHNQADFDIYKMTVLAQGGDVDEPAVKRAMMMGMVAEKDKFDRFAVIVADAMRELTPLNSAQLQKKINEAIFEAQSKQIEDQAKAALSAVDDKPVIGPKIPATGGDVATPTTVTTVPTTVTTEVVVAPAAVTNDNAAEVTKEEEKETLGNGKEE